MKHEFTDKQITTAANKSLFHYGEYNSERGYSWSMTAESLRSFLNALPEPQDDWQQCTFSQVSEHDLKAKVVWDDFAMEGEISAVDEGAIYIADRGVVDIGGDWKKIYRIPAPVKYPNPLDHPAIVVIEARDYNIQEPAVFVWTGGRYENEDWTFDEDDITKWHPIDVAKVVSADE